MVLFSLLSGSFGNLDLIGGLILIMSASWLASCDVCGVDSDCFFDEIPFPFFLFLFFCFSCNIRNTADIFEATPAIFYCLLFLVPCNFRPSPRRAGGTMTLSLNPFRCVTGDGQGQG